MMSSRGVCSVPARSGCSDVDLFVVIIERKDDQSISALARPLEREAQKGKTIREAPELALSVRSSALGCPLNSLGSNF